jgi:hypothetical protein
LWDKTNAYFPDKRGFWEINGKKRPEKNKQAPQFSVHPFQSGFNRRVLTKKNRAGSGKPKRFCKACTEDYPALS